MSAGDRDTLAALLAKHRWDRTEAIPSFGCKCECGEPVCTPDGGQSHDWHFRAHVADVLLASDWLRVVKAEAKAAAVRDAVGIIEVVGGHDEPNIEKETAASWLERFAAEIVDEATEDTE